MVIQERFLMKRFQHERRKSFAKWALPGQHNGGMTAAQLAQSRKDKTLHRLKSSRGFAMMQSNSVIAFKPRTCLSRDNFRPNKCKPRMNTPKNLRRTADA